MPKSRATPSNPANEYPRMPSSEPRSCSFLVLFLVSVVTTAAAIYADAAIGRASLLAFVAVAAAAKRLSLSGAVGLLLPFMFLISVGVTVNFGLVDVALPVLVVATAMACWRSKFYTSVLRLPGGFSIFFLSWAGLSFLAAPAIAGYQPVGSSFVAEVMKLVVCLALFGSVSVHVALDHARGRTDLLRSWSAMAVAVGSLGTLELLTPVSSGVRFTAGFDNPNLLSLYLVTSLAVVSFWRVARERLPVGIESIVLLGGILATGGRGSFGAALVFVVLLPVLGGVRNAAAAFIGFVGALATGLFIFAFGSAIPVLERLFEENRSVEEDIRVTLWSAAIDVWSTSPLSGVGLGQFSQISPSYTGSSTGFVAHNTYLSFLSETGLVGAAAFIALIAVIAIRLFLLRSVGDQYLVAAIVWLPILANMMTLNAENARFIWVFLGLCHGTYMAITRPKTTEDTVPRSKPVGLQG